MDYSLLSASSLFAGIRPDEIEKIIRNVPYRVRKINEGSLIAQTGEPVGSLMIVLTGKVKGEMIDFAGKVIKIEDIPASGALASAFMFGNKNRFPVNVVAMTEVSLLSIDKADFLKMLKSDERILVNFLDMISNRSQFLSEKIKFLNFKTIKGKLAQFILQRAGKERNSVNLDITQAEIADFFGVARPSVARALGEMEHDGLISASAKNIRIIDRKKLSALTSE
jgi:CRP-like cAMP-binding protein